MGDERALVQNIIYEFINVITQYDEAVAHFVCSTRELVEKFSALHKEGVTICLMLIKNKREYRSDSSALLVSLKKIIKMPK